MIKRKTSSFDLTPLLDVILILLFLALIINAGEVIDYRNRLDESIEQITGIEQANKDLENQLGVMNDRLEALSDWDSERSAMMSELDALAGWKDVAEGAVHFISLDISTIDETRTVNIVTKTMPEQNIEIIWAEDGSNTIINRSEASADIRRILSEITEPFTDEQPVLIMFNETGIRLQEYYLIDNEINAFKDAVRSGQDLSIYYTIFKDN